MAEEIHYEMPDMEPGPLPLPEEPIAPPRSPPPQSPKRAPTAQPHLTPGQFYAKFPGASLQLYIDVYGDQGGYSLSSFSPSAQTTPSPSATSKSLLKVPPMFNGD